MWLAPYIRSSTCSSWFPSLPSESPTFPHTNRDKFVIKIKESKILLSRFRILLSYLYLYLYILFTLLEMNYTSIGNSKHSCLYIIVISVSAIPASISVVKTNNSIAVVF